MKRSHRIGGIALLLLLLLARPASAQLVRENAAPIENRGAADLSQGLLIDNTVTVLGREFFEGFATTWRELDTLQRHSLSIHESPTARLGSSVRVQHKTMTIYQTLLRPNRQAARDLSQQAATELFRTVISAEADGLFRDPDLAPQELQ